MEHIEITSGAPYQLANILHSSCRSDVYFKSSLNENQGNIINGSLHLNAHVNFSLNAYKQYDNGQYKLTKRFFKQGPANTSMFAVENQSVVKL